MNTYSHFAAANAASANRFLQSVNMKVGAYSLDETTRGIDGAGQVTLTHTAGDTVDTLGTVTITGTDLSGQTISEVLTESRNGTVVVDLEGYEGPGKIIVQVGPLIRGNSVRDATGFIEFGEFKEQTEFGQVSKEINKRVAADVLGDVDLENLMGKTVDFDGTFSISTINQTSIDLSEITVTPVTYEVE